MKFDHEKISEDVASTVVEASTTFRPDQVEAFKRAGARETDPQIKWVLEKFIENGEVGKKESLPLCDDTGIPHVFLEVGKESFLPAGFLSAVHAGVAEGLKKLPGRPMAVKGDDKERISQSAGLYKEPEMLELTPLQIKEVPGAQVKLTILMLGGGPEIRVKTLRVFHKHSAKVVVDEMVAWAIEGAAKLGCLPCVPAFGIGRTNYEAASLAMEALKDGNFLKQRELEKEITARLNESNLGPMGIGGRSTALGTFVKVGPQRASGVRIVSMRMGCSFDPRRAVCTWDFTG